MFDSRGQVSFGAAENEELYRILSGVQPLGHLDRESDRTSSILEKFKKRVKPHEEAAPVIHLAVLVVSKDVTDDELVGISGFVDSLARMKLKVIAILTKVDNLTDKEIETVANRITAVGVAKVCPMINLPMPGLEKRVKDARSSRLMLIAMKTILSCFETYTYQYAMETPTQMNGSWGAVTWLGVLTAVIYILIAFLVLFKKLI